MRFVKTSIRNKLIVLLLSAVVIPTSISIAMTYMFTKQSLKERFIEENTSLLLQGRQLLLSHMELLNRASLSPYGNSSLYNILTSSNRQLQQNTELYSQVYAQLQNIYSSADDIFRVALLIDHNGDYYSLLDEGILSRRRPPESSFRYAPYSAYVEPTHATSPLNLQHADPLKPEQVFTLNRPLQHIPSDDLLGWLSIDVKTDALRGWIENLYRKGKESFYIIDASGTVIYSSDESLNGRPLPMSWSDEILKSDSETGSRQLHRPDFSGVLIYNRVKTDYMEWTLVKSIPDEELYRYAFRLTSFNTWLAALFLILSTVAVVIVCIRLTRPIKQFIRHIARIQTGGHLQQPLDLHREDEIGVLSRKFQALMDTINDYIIREYKSDLASKTIQLKMLQAQINPHFINNALQSIGHLALKHKNKDIYHLISALGQMMHYNMDTEESKVLLSDEIRHIERYLSLQRQRFGDSLQYRIEADSAAMMQLVPKMILQPVVENCFLHGFALDTGEKRIMVRLFIRDETFIMEVEDNGEGADELRLQTIRSSLSEDALKARPPGGRIGLSNVLLRLQLHYRKSVTIELNTVKPHGLLVRFAIPLTEEGEYNESSDRG